MKKSMSRYSEIRPSERLPEWLRRPIGNASAIEQVQSLVKQNGLNTICEEAAPSAPVVVRSAKSIKAVRPKP